ncbi:MAG: hypothetical protein DDT40_00640 [candidate division WS2 bacterium]|nr:hypothetical protein [Candidatus Psychracetigena formicireducens]MBT9150468.1 hypothetical protein [Candidatus Psychracetigena formicireducens]
MAIDFSSLPAYLRKFLLSLWAGWKITSNWTEPLLFMVYLIVKPLSSVLILIVMFYVITGSFTGEQLLFIYVGNAFFSIVRAGVSSVWVITEDREWFETIKPIFISPGSYLSHILGRTSAEFLFSVFSSVILLVAGFFVLKLPLGINLPLFISTIILTLIITTILALLFCSVAFFVGHGGEFIVEGASGFLYLFSGVIFPASTLPTFLRIIAEANPITHLTNFFRASLGVSAAPQVELWKFYLISLIILALSYFIFNRALKLALKTGMFDQKLGH